MRKILPDSTLNLPVRTLAPNEIEANLGWIMGSIKGNKTRVDWVGLSTTRTRTRNSNTTSRDTLQFYFHICMFPFAIVDMSCPIQTGGGSAKL